MPLASRHRPVHHIPRHVRGDRETPLVQGRNESDYTANQNF